MMITNMLLLVLVSLLGDRGAMAQTTCLASQQTVAISVNGVPEAILCLNDVDTCINSLIPQVRDLTCPSATGTGSTSGTGTGSTSGTDTGSTSGTGTGSTSGTNTGSTSGTDTGSTSGTGTGSTSGTNTGSTSGTGTESTSGTGTGSTSGTGTGSTDPFRPTCAATQNKITIKLGMGANAVIVHELCDNNMKTCLNDMREAESRTNLKSCDNQWDCPSGTCQYYTITESNNPPTNFNEVSDRSGLYCGDTTSNSPLDSRTNCNQAQAVLPPLASAPAPTTCALNRYTTISQGNVDIAHSCGTCAIQLDESENIVQTCRSDFKCYDYQTATPSTQVCLPFTVKVSGVPMFTKSYCADAATGNPFQSAAFNCAFIPFN